MIGVTQPERRPIKLLKPAGRYYCPVCYRNGNHRLYLKKAIGGLRCARCGETFAKP